MAELEIEYAMNYDKSEDFKPKDIEATSIVHFRPKSDWDGKDYGFDWMRIDDYKHVADPNRARADKNKFKDTISFHYKTGTKTPETNGNADNGDFVNNPKLFEVLEKEYEFAKIKAKPIQDTGGETDYERYYCSWMSIYPKDKVTISIIVDVLTDDIPKELKFVENEFLTCSFLKPVTGLKKGINAFADAVSVECKQEFKDDQEITIIAIDKNDEERVAGRLYVWANDATKRKKAKVVSIRVKIKKTKTNDEDLTMNSSNDPISKNQEFTKLYLKQAYIELEEDLLLDLDCTDDEFKNLYICPEGVIGYYYTATTPVRNEKKNRWDITYKKAPDKFIRMTDELRDRLHEQEGDKYDDYQQIFYFEEDGGGAYFKEEGGIDVFKLNKHGGYADENKTIIMFKSPMPFMVAHELGHAFSLPHTFSMKEACKTAEFTYTVRTTDVIMDYSHNAKPAIKMVCFFHWQWKIMNNSIMQNGSINRLD